MTHNQPEGTILSLDLFPVVGIGASAGGLDAFKKFIQAIPPQSGIAYVLVQHLDPGHQSMLPDLLQKITTIPVIEISDDLKVHPNHIYIIPSNKMLIANNGHLELSPRPDDRNGLPNLPIDLFFDSLAQVHREHSIGVVLSGTAKDGTRGLAAIKAHGGITFAQDDLSAIYDSMPRSARDAGVVDFVLPPEQIPLKIIELLREIDQRVVKLQQPDADHVIRNQILVLLRERKGIDFTYYKQSTIQRRIGLRIALSGKDSLAEYQVFLLEHDSEIDRLYQALLIPVTSFFRDEKTFELLANTVFPGLFRDEATETIRIWVAGCSTGQEAYSLAICINEFLGERPGKVQIFATDISDPAIARARSGRYSVTEMAGLTPERLNKYFTHTDDTFQVVKKIRDMCIFAHHDFVSDPPYRKLDIISCRNVLIYMDEHLQQKALAGFHYGLKPKGVLLLGSAESIKTATDIFSVFNAAARIFSRKNHSVNAVLPWVIQSSAVVKPQAKTGEGEPSFNFHRSADEIILSRFTPAAVVVNESMDIVYYRGNTGLYLTPSEGKPSHNLSRMAKTGLAFELRNILLQAQTSKKSVSKERVPLLENDKYRYVSIEAIPMTKMAEPHYLVLFSDSVVQEMSAPELSGENGKENNNYLVRIHQLESELVQTREDMRTVAEYQEAANTDLQGANEELQSTGEELQSLNDELEASKEELQNTNEELHVLNQALTDASLMITQARDYSDAIITSVRTPLVVVDKEFRIKTANLAFSRLFQQVADNLHGKMLSQITGKEWEVQGLDQVLKMVVEQQEPLTDFRISSDFPVIGKRVLLLNATQLALHGEDKLVLLSLEDVTDAAALKAKEKAFQRELEIEIETRTVELKYANQELEHRNNALVNANKELESFTHISSHDLQEPLRKIQTFTNKILNNEEHLSTSGRDNFDKIKQASHRMQVLLEDLIIYSRTSEADRVLEEVSLTHVVEEAMSELSEVIKEKRAVVDATGLCAAKINAFQFRQVMINLIGNALKFSRADIVPHITIRSKITTAVVLERTNTSLLGKLDPVQQYCHITVADNGIGFDQKYSEQIFGVFERLYGKDEYPGTGVGLAIVRKVVTNHAGFVFASGRLNEGASFEIVIPHDLPVPQASV